MNQYVRDNLVPIVVILVGGAISLALAIAPLDFLISNLIPDDAFYYFQIARNIVHGAGSTFDGLNATNGFHPLWLLILLPIFHFFPSGAGQDILPIHIALGFSALLNVAFGFVLLAIVSRYTSRPWIKAIALGTWFFNPFNLFEMTSGLETPLSIFFIALLILCALRLSEKETPRMLIGTGIIGGLMMLARLDNVFYFAMFLVWLLYCHGWRAGFVRALWVGIPATLVVLPWLVWNELTFGMLFTSASLATTLVDHQLIIQDHGTSLFQQFKAAVYTTDLELRHVATHTGAPSVFFILLGVALGWLTFGAGRARALFARPLPVEYFLAAGFILNFVVNATIRWSARPWYFIPLNIFLAMWIAWLLEKLRESGHLRKSIVALIVCLTLALYFISWSKELRGTLQSQRQLFASTQWMNADLPKGSIIGAFNAGIIGYFSDHRVVNLDGLVNNSGFEALRDRTLWSYMQQQKIGYVSDSSIYFTYRYKSFFGIDDALAHLELIHAVGDTDGVNIFRVK